MDYFILSETILDFMKSRFSLLYKTISWSTTYNFSGKIKLNDTGNEECQGSVFFMNGITLRVKDRIILAVGAEYHLYYLLGMIMFGV